MQINFSRSPYPMFGLTASAGSAVRSDPTDASDKTARLRLDLELVYNSVAGPSTDDSVDSHGSPHGTVRVELGGRNETVGGWWVGKRVKGRDCSLNRKAATLVALDRFLRV